MGYLKCHKCGRTGNQFCYGEAHTKYGLSMIQYNSLSSAIKVGMKSLAQDQSDPLICETIGCDKVTSKMYNKLLDRRRCKDAGLKSWEEKLNIQFDDEQAIFMHVKHVTTVGKLRSFQYRLLRNVISTNVHLKRWGLSDTDLCTFCHAQKENIQHLLYDCCEVKPLWKTYYEFCEKWFGSNIALSISIKNIILNSVCENNRFNVINFLCLVVKQYIYRQRCTKKPLNSSEMVRLFYTYKNSERYNAIVNNKLRLHERKWNPNIKWCDQPQDVDDCIKEYIEKCINV